MHVDCSACCMLHKSMLRYSRSVSSTAANTVVATKQRTAATFLGLKDCNVAQDPFTPNMGVGCCVSRQTWVRAVMLSAGARASGQRPPGRAICHLHKAGCPGLPAAPRTPQASSCPAGQPAHSRCCESRAGGRQSACNSASARTRATAAAGGPVRLQHASTGAGLHSGIGH